MTAQGFNGLKVAAFESRMAAEMADLIRHHGGEPLVAPSMREIPLENNTEALEFGTGLVAGHYHVLIESDAFEGKTLLEQHRMVNDALRHLFGDQIHALAITTKTP